MVLKHLHIEAAVCTKPARLQGHRPVLRCNGRQRSRLQVYASANGSAPAIPSTSAVRKLGETGETATGASILSKVMHKAFKIKPETTMEAAANLVVNKKAHRICVVDEDDRLIGIVSRGDIMRATMVHFAAYMDHKDKAQAASS